MLLNTSDNMPRMVTIDAHEAKRAQLLAWIQKEDAECLRDCTEVEDNPTIVMSRIGRPMHADVFERRLKVLNPNLNFAWNELNSTKKAMFLGKTYLFPYCYGLLPERSIMAIHEEMVPDPIVYTKGFVVERSQLNADGTSSYFKKQKKVWNEVQRGWRTVLLKLVKCGALTPTQVETTFGAANTKEWQGHLGKIAVSTPW